jgi:hypothetical protein
VDKIWRDIYIASINTQDITISGNRIETTLTDSNLLLSGNGTGNTRLEGLLFGNNSITSTVLNSNIVLAPSSNSNLVIASSTAFRVPRTTVTLNRTGEIRFNTSTGLFDGFSTALVGFGGVYSADRQTSLLAHPTNNTIIFRADNVATTVIDSTGLTTNALHSDGLQLDNNTITSIGSNDLILVADSVNVQNLTINDNTISPSTLNSNLELGATGAAGYIQFTGTGALEFPVGDNASRPLAPVVGNTRFNPEVQYTEVWSGTAWIPVTGVGELSTFEYANEQTTLWSIILG